MKTNPLFIAHSSLTAFWTIFAVVLLLIAQRFDSKSLRAASLALLGLTFFKAVPLELLRRPDNLTPLINPFIEKVCRRRGGILTKGNISGKITVCDDNFSWSIERKQCVISLHLMMFPSRN
ncbi:MAG: DUF2339 domain-containing protein [Planctomycetaceae bacterium]|nr:DUF2339 domain-containing protein [Planctomycetaceae bacterium]